MAGVGGEGGRGSDGEVLRAANGSVATVSAGSMLRELHISNLAVIADARIELSAGLNCFTGATGAGKSLVIGALELLLGLRSPNDLLRKGAEEGRVSGLFEVADAGTRKRISEVTDVPLPTGELLLTRRLFASNRSTVSLNGQPITLAMLKAAAEHLVDVHGQHDHQYLLRPSNQLDVLDEFAGNSSVRARYQAAYGALADARRRLEELTHGQSVRRQQLELYRFQLGEIDAAQLAPGEYDAHVSTAGKLGNVERLQREGGTLQTALVDAEEPLVERVKSAAAALGELAALDPALGPVAASVRDASLTLEEGARDLDRYLSHLDFDPEALAFSNERLTLIHRLADKYASRVAAGRSARHGSSAETGGPVSGQQAGRPGAAVAGCADDVDAVLAYREHLAREIADLEQQSEDLTSLETGLAPLEREARGLAETLSAARGKAAGKLSKQVEHAMKDLGLERATFTIQLSQGDRPPSRADADPTPPSATRPSPARPSPPCSPPSPSVPQCLSASVHSSCPLTPTGIDQIEFIATTNPGLAPAPLRKIGSGGELSRIMLALKGILSENGRVSVLVFDEIDSNVGGRLGAVIGNKLRALARGHQVLCITHLPQIAAYAHRHLTVRKAQSKDETTSTITHLTGDAQLAELAEMIGGHHITETTRAQARELLEAARR